MGRHLFFGMKWLLPLLLIPLVSCSKPGGESGSPAPQTPPAKEELADPADVPPELVSLRLTVDQLAKLKAWQDEHKEEIMNPAALATFIKSILRDEAQRKAFDEILASGGAPAPRRPENGVGTGDY